ncbi:hypothetical protein AHF37_05184 [Paragonimus kellicotti]|nr:hypothetical protein AHF37_05184 [Paragonimus kellicotti]
MRYTQHYYLTSTEHESSIATSLDYTSEPDLISLGKGFPFPADNGTRLVWDIRSPPSSTMRAICLEYTHSPSVFKASSSTEACSPTVGTFVQIWSSGRLLKTIMLPTLEPTLVHGKVYADADGTFIGASWSSDSKKIVYLAEALRAERSESNESASLSTTFRYQDNWGEGLFDVSQTVLCLLNVSDGVSSCVVSPDNLPDVAPTKPVWCPADSGIVFMGYALETYRLGLKYCTQRPCRLYHLDFATGKIRSISNAHKSADCPRFSPDGKHLIWLENDVGGPHQQCRALMELRWPWDGQTMPTVVVPVIEKPKDPSGFPVSDSRLTDFNEWLPLIHCSSIHGLVVYPHGGPHSAFTATWSPLIIGLVACGFACLLINYRGSLGYGETAVRSLLGKIAQNDVDDCFQATTCALNKLEKDYGRKLSVVLFGGSHGGFLVLHLAARYPHLFRAAVVRNPVTNLISMLDTSDIPDWDYVEAGFNVDNVWPLGSIPSDSCLSIMASMSPLFKLDSTWTVPLLLVTR